MSVYEDRQLGCPHCGHEALRAVAVSIDGPASPRGEHQAILDGTFQRWPCDACGRAFRADGPLIAAVSAGAYVDLGRVFAPGRARD